MRKKSHRTISETKDFCLATKGTTMSNRSRLRLIAVVTAMLVIPVAVSATPPDRVPVIVKFAPGPQGEAAQSHAAQHGPVRREFHNLGMKLLELPEHVLARAFSS